MPNIDRVPLRVDFAGGWLDVPRLARPGAFIVNCTITPMVSLEDWPYQKPGAGLGGSAAWSILNGRDPFRDESRLGVGWQDPAVILETGLCVWRSGPTPVLEAKVNPDFLSGLLGLLWTGQPHDCPSLVDRPRDYDVIAAAGRMAAIAVGLRSVKRIAKAIQASDFAQECEGMQPLPDFDGCTAFKYCGGGWGGYAAYLFATRAARDASGLVPVEPYMKEPTCPAAS